MKPDGSYKFTVTIDDVESYSVTNTNPQTFQNGRIETTNTQWDPMAGGFYCNIKYTPDLNSPDVFYHENLIDPNPPGPTTTTTTASTTTATTTTTMPTTTTPPSKFHEILFYLLKSQLDKFDQIKIWNSRLKAFGFSLTHHSFIYCIIIILYRKLLALPFK